MDETLTDEEQQFLKDNPHLLAGSESSDGEEGTGDVSSYDQLMASDPDFAAMVKNNPTIDFKKSMEVDDTVDPTKVTGAAGFVTDVTAQSQIAADEMNNRDSMTYGNIYGEKPTVGYGTQLSAAVGIGQGPDGEPGPAQVEMAQYESDLADFKAAAKETYNTTGFKDGNDRIYRKEVPEKDDKGNVTGYKSVDVIIPEPDSTSFERVVEQSGRNIYQQVGGLLTEGAILEESDLEKAVPDFELSGGEQFFTTMLSLMVPIIPAMKITKGVVNYGGKLIKAGELGTKGVIAADAVSAAAVEAIMSGNADEGLILKPEAVANLTGNRFSEDTNKNLAMFVDGLFINGALDGLITVAGKAKNWGASKVSSARLLANRDALKELVTNDSVINVVKFLDPEISDLAPAEVKYRLLNLAEKLNDNAIISLALGKATADIGVDTTTAIMRSSEAYIAETRQSLRNTMSETEFDDFVALEAAKMSKSMMDLLRSQSTDTAVANASQRVVTDVGEFIQNAAVDNLPVGANTVDEAAQLAAGSLLRTSDDVVGELQDTASAVTKQTDEILKSQKTVLQDNPILFDLVGDVSGDSPIFNVNLQEYRDNVNSIITDKVYPEFVKTMDEVNAAYKNLPEADIDAKALKEQLFLVVREANEINSAGGDQARAVLRDIFEGYSPQTISTKPSPIPIVGEDNLLRTAETSAEVIERITENIKFSDLYQIKADLQVVIDRYRDQPAIQQRLIQFRRHLTDAEDGQMAYVIKNSSPEVAAKFSEADQLYKTAKSKFSNSEPVRQLETVLTNRKKYAGSAYPGEVARHEPDLKLQANQFVDEISDDATGTLRKQLNYMVEGVVSPEELAEPFKLMFVANATDALRQAVILSDGSINPEQALVNAFRPIRDNLKALGATDILNNLDDAFRQVRDAHRGLGDIAVANDELLKQIDARAAAAQEGILKNLISPVAGRQTGFAGTGPTKSVPTSSARIEFEKMLTGKDSVNKIKALKEKIDELPNVLEKEMAIGALQAIALDVVGKKIFGSTQTGMRSGTNAYKSINQGSIAKLTADEASDFMKSIDALYPNDDLMAEAVFRTLDTLYQVATPGRIKNAPGSDTAFNLTRGQQIKDATSTSILLFAGYMNPTAAMLRRLVDVPIKEAAQIEKDVAANVLAVLVTSPTEFSIALKAIVEGKSESIRRRLAREAINATARTGRYEIRVQEGDEYGQEDPAPLVDRDMTEIFGARDLLGVQ